MALPNSADQLDGTNRGYCATPYRGANSKCPKTTTKVAVQPGEPSKPTKRKRDGDELFEKMDFS